MAPEYTAARVWMASGQQSVEAAVASLDDLAVAQPSALPNWTRGHVLSHLARNAEALTNLVTWARTGVETPMYASPEARDAEIEAAAGDGVEVLVDELRSTASRFAAELDALTPDQLAFVVVTRGGLSRPVADVAWMRVREVWLHLVDLDLGVSMADVPTDVCLAVADDVLRAFARRPDCTPFAARITDTGAEYVVSAGGPMVSGGPVVIADARTMAGWLTGRGHTPPAADGTPAPQLPAWL